MLNNKNHDNQAQLPLTRLQRQTMILIARRIHLDIQVAGILTR